MMTIRRFTVSEVPHAPGRPAHWRVWDWELRRVASKHSSLQAAEAEAMRLNKQVTR